MMLDFIPIEIKYLAIGVLYTVIGLWLCAAWLRRKEQKAREAVMEAAIHNNARSTAEVLAPKIGREHAQAIYRAVRGALGRHELWVCREQERHVGREKQPL
jgi:hypothetical protein